MAAVKALYNSGCCIRCGVCCHMWVQCMVSSTVIVSVRASYVPPCSCSDDLLVSSSLSPSSAFLLAAIVRTSCNHQGKGDYHQFFKRRKHAFEFPMHYSCTPALTMSNVHQRCSYRGFRSSGHVSIVLVRVRMGIVVLQDCPIWTAK